MHHEIGHMVGYPLPYTSDLKTPSPVHQTWGPTPLGQHLSVATETETPSFQAGGMHPVGMLSCLTYANVFIYLTKLVFGMC